VLGELDFDTCAFFIAGGRRDEDNVMAALYAYHKGVPKVYARIFEARLIPLVSSLGVTPLQTSHVAAAFVTLRLLKPAVAQLVALSPEGRFGMTEVRASDYPELVGCRLGNLHADRLHIVAVARDENISLGYNTIIKADSKLIVIYDRQIEADLRTELRKVAQQAAQYFRQNGHCTAGVPVGYDLPALRLLILVLMCQGSEGLPGDEFPSFDFLFNGAIRGVEMHCSVY